MAGMQQGPPYDVELFESWYWSSVAKEAWSRWWAMVVADKRHVAFTALVAAIATVAVAFLQFGRQAGVDAMQALASGLIASASVWLTLWLFYMFRIPPERAARQRSGVERLSVAGSGTNSASQPANELKLEYDESLHYNRRSRGLVEVVCKLTNTGSERAKRVHAKIDSLIPNNDDTAANDDAARFAKQFGCHEVQVINKSLGFNLDPHESVLVKLIRTKADDLRWLYIDGHVKAFDVFKNAHGELEVHARPWSPL
jgi:hypothetical protein